MKYTCISLAGEDRVSFLQGQLTQDIGLLTPGFNLPAAWCSPKGRVLLTCRLLGLENRVLMILPTASQETALKRLALYRLRAKVDIAAETGWRTLAFAGEAAAQAATTLGLNPDADQHWQNELHVLRLPGPDGAIEVLASEQALAASRIDLKTALSDSNWSRARIAAGHAEIDTSNAEKYTAHMLNLDKVGAVSFDKGCYTGQEVVARTQHLGKVKRRIARFRSSEPLAPGNKLQLDGTDVGEVVNASGRDLLAVVPVALAEQELESPGGIAKPEALPYAID